MGLTFKFTGLPPAGEGAEEGGYGEKEKGEKENVGGRQIDLKGPTESRTVDSEDEQKPQAQPEKNTAGEAGQCHEPAFRSGRNGGFFPRHAEDPLYPQLPAIFPHQAEEGEDQAGERNKEADPLKAPGDREGLLKNRHDEFPQFAVFPYFKSGPVR